LDSGVERIRFHIQCHLIKVWRPCCARCRCGELPPFLCRMGHIGAIVHTEGGHKALVGVGTPGTACEPPPPSPHPVSRTMARSPAERSSRILIAGECVSVRICISLYDDRSMTGPYWPRHGSEKRQAAAAQICLGSRLDGLQRLVLHSAHSSCTSQFSKSPISGTLFSAGEATNIFEAPTRKTLVAGDRPRRASPQWPAWRTDSP